MPIKNPTRHKLQEAEYFLSKMEEAFDDNDVFYYNLSPFLTAAQGIIDYMKNQYEHQDGFNDWFCQKWKEIREDDELIYLKKARNTDVHEEPMQTVATREVSFTINGVIADVDGTIPDAQPKQVESTPSEKGSPRLVRRFFPAPFGDVDVIPFCKKQWCKLKKLVDECEQCFS